MNCSERSVVLRPGLWLGLAILIWVLPPVAVGDTILILPGTGEGDPFGGPITIQTANGEFANEYINTTGKVILDMHFQLNPGDGLVGVMTDFFSKQTINQDGTAIDVFAAGADPGIAENQVFLLDFRGIGDKTTITITPTFTGVPEPSTMILTASFLAALLALKRRFQLPHHPTSKWNHRRRVTSWGFSTSPVVRNEQR